MHQRQGSTSWGETSSPRAYGRLPPSWYTRGRPIGTQKRISVVTGYWGETDYEHDKLARTGILLVNLGTPDSPDAGSVRRYLAEFLWDPRVIEMPRPLWWLILHGVILRIRPRRSAEAYRKVWTERGSPLLDISLRQAAALKAELDRTLSGPAEVELGMRYGKPSVSDALRRLGEAGVRRLLVLPLYPQYSATTTASTFDAVAAELTTWRWIPELRFVTQYHDNSGYIAAIAASLREAWSNQPRAERLLFSFHGLPKRYLLAGDPYHCACHKTARLVAEQLGLESGSWSLAFQSRVGREEWLRPYTDEQLLEWGKAGVRSVDVICPGFSADCLETLEEIAIQNRELFQEAGGGDYRYIAALNDRPDHIGTLADIVKAHIQGWPESDPAYDERRALEIAAETKSRALESGAPG